MIVSLRAKDTWMNLTVILLSALKMFRMTRRYLLHLVDELVGHGYLKEGHGGVDAKQAVTMFLYILGHNT